MGCKTYELLKNATALDDYRVAVVFANGERGIFDCRPYLSMGCFKPLNDPALFKRVGVSYGWLNWPGDIDIGADDVCYPIGTQGCHCVLLQPDFVCAA